DFFLSHRVLVSNSQKKVYFTYNGGPVFRLERQPGSQKVAQSEPAPVIAAPPTAGPTAAELVRRAAASAARRDFAAAIADYGRAIELEPNNAAAYQARALVRLN